MWSPFTIASPESPAVVRERIAAALTTATPPWLYESITLRGTVSDTGFRVIRNLGRMERGFPLVATGRITPAGTGTQVTVATRPTWWGLMLLGVWSAFWIGLMVRRLVFDPLPSGIHWGEITLLLGMVVFGWGGMFVYCVSQERDYRATLSRIVNGIPNEQATTPSG